MKKYIVLTSICFVLFLSCVTLIVLNRNLKRNIADFSQQNEEKLQTQVTAERERLKRNLHEKYMADKVSYKAMVKRLQTEHEKNKAMEQRIATLQESNENKEKE